MALAGVLYLVRQMEGIKEPRTLTDMCTKQMNTKLQIQLDRTGKLSLSEQIRISIKNGIEAGLLEPGSRLPSWQDLAAHLGVARGTVQAAYERLSDSRMIETFGAKGTRIAPRQTAIPALSDVPEPGTFMETYQRMNTGPAIFQLGIPALDVLPKKFFARAHSSNLLKISAFPTHTYPDPCGELLLRRQIAGYLAIARNFHCLPQQIFITSGYSSGLGLTLRVLGLEGKKVWMEEPGFFLTRKGLELGRLQVTSVPVDGHGMDIDYGIRNAPDAALAVLTPGQQAPLGAALSIDRRVKLLDWAATANAWIVEDDYLSELQLEGRAVPALASAEGSNRVIHIGSFSKTISPALRLGFVVVPLALKNDFFEAAATLAPAPSPVTQIAVAKFMQDGHYTRRVRRLKHLYSSQANALCAQLTLRNATWTKAGLTVLLRLPDGAPDLQIVEEAMKIGIAPSPLSSWYANSFGSTSGLLLGVATAPEACIASSCDRLYAIIQQHL